MSEHLEPLRRGSHWVALLGFLAFAVLGSVSQTVAARGNLAMGRRVVTGLVRRVNNRDLGVCGDVVFGHSVGVQAGAS
jgi:hypothetical protein